MTVSSHLATNGTELTISISGRFDFSEHQAFRETYEAAPATVQTYRIDMSDATYLDSSALGMLLLLRDFAGGDSADINIVNCNTDVKKILTISNFGQLFHLA